MIQNDCNRQILAREYKENTLCYEALKTTEHFKIPLFTLPLLPSPIVVIRKVLRYKLTCSVDHIIGQAILSCCMLGVG